MFIVVLELSFIHNEDAWNKCMQDALMQVGGIGYTDYWQWFI